MPQTIHLHDKAFTLLLPYEKILEAIERMAEKMNHDFETEKPLFLVVLKGAFMFAGELMKAVNRDCDIEFIRVKSYEGMESTGKMELQMAETLNIEGRAVVILEDIVDTGNTLEYLYETLKKRGAKEVKIATLFFKSEAYQKTKTLDYVGLEIPNAFVVGFGLDYNQRGRGFRDLYALVQE